ncbi:trypsin-like serine protease [Lysinibacillus sp. SGAir0095]|uniref:TcaA NTF2-like domain-containing protein n=1 Tax=Lysinibacillus sp. SGAir0095 TaxID=2070463 RepID=UPI001F0F6D5C|nr:trypsin-like serine protease [Lysinibacillus sp. SGAir0095]
MISKRTWIIMGILITILSTVVISFAIFNAVINPQKTVTEDNTKIETDPSDSIPQKDKDKTQIIKESMPKVFTILTDEAQGLYQVDAQIDEGSSGGPLIDATTGEVIGINSLLYTSNTSFGFAIPLYRVASLINDWITNPMDETQVATVFGSYEEFFYADPSVGEEDVYYDEYEDFWNNEEDTFGTYEYFFEEESLSEFIIYFRDYYEYALYYEDFYWIQDLVLPGSSAYLELEQYIHDISGQGYEFFFLTNTITNVEILEDYAIVTTNEEFDFYNAAGENTTYNKNKEYTVIIDEYGYYQITEIHTTN